MPKIKLGSSTRDMNIRGVPDELYWQCKAMAVAQRLSLRDYVISVLEKAANKEESEVPSKSRRKSGAK